MKKKTNKYFEYTGDGTGELIWDRFIMIPEGCACPTNTKYWRECTKEEYYNWSNNVLNIDNKKKIVLPKPPSNVLIKEGTDKIMEKK